MATHFHQTWTSGKNVLVNQSLPFYWCIVPPKTAWSTGELNFTYISDELPIQRLGWAEIKGFMITDIRALNQSLNSFTPREIWDDYVPKIDPVNFDVGTTFSDDERIQSLREGTEGSSDNNPLTDDVQGSDVGEDDVQSESLLSHPAVFNQVDWLGLGPNMIYENSSPLGYAVGKGMLVTDKTQRFVWQVPLKIDMKAAQRGTVSVVIFGISIPELGAANSGPFDEETERLSPWSHYPTMLRSFMAAEREFVDMMVDDDLNDRSEEFRELIAWKRIYSVGDDTWQNINGKFFVRGSTTLSSNLNQERRHI